MLVFAICFWKAVKMLTSCTDLGWSKGPKSASTLVESITFITVGLKEGVPGIAALLPLGEVLEMHIHTL